MDANSLNWDLDNWLSKDDKLKDCDSDSGGGRLNSGGGVRG